MLGRSKGEYQQVYIPLSAKRSAMATLQLELPTDLERKIDDIMEEEDFIDREEAVQAILRAGVTAFETDNTTDEFGEVGGFEEEMIDSNYDDEYAF